MVDFIIHLNEKKIPQITANFGGVILGTLNQIIEELKEYTSSKSKILHVPIQLKDFLKFFSKIKILPVTPWQLSVMYKDYFFDNEVLYSTGFKYKHQPMDALKNMIDYYKNSNFK